jgi:hypothetical protein
MRLQKLVSMLVLAMPLVAGCQSVAMPTLYPQGSVSQQQYNAQRFDPLPEPDTAPAIVGGRGRESEYPVAAPSRSRWDPRTWVQRWGW